MGPVQLPVNKPVDMRGVRYKAFQLVQGERAEVSITLDPAVLPQLGKPLVDRTTNVHWTRIVMLSRKEPYAAHTGLAAAVMVEWGSSGGEEPVVMMMAQS